MNIATDCYLQRSDSTDSIFQDIIGHEDVKVPFSMYLDSKEPVSILLSVVSSSGKTMFLQCLMKLDKNSSSLIKGNINCFSNS